MATKTKQQVRGRGEHVVEPLEQPVGPFALAPKMTNAAASTACDALAALMNSGFFRIYDGTPPATADTALSGNTLLAELTFGATAFAGASNGAAAANAIGADTSANNTGTASFYRTFASNGTTVVLQGTVDTSGANLNLNSTAISAGAQVSVTAFTLTINVSG